MQSVLDAIRRLGLSHAIVALLTAVLAAGVTIVIDQPAPTPRGPGASTVPHRTITVTLGGPGKTKVALSPPAQAVATGQALDQAAGDSDAAESQLHAEPPAAGSPNIVDHDNALAPTGQTPAPVSVPLASVHQDGCRTLAVRNYSTRAGAPSLLIVLHQTISPDNGWNGVLGVVRWFDNPTAQASSNYIVSRAGGQCAYIVPETAKAWAQAGFNRVTPCSIEVTETGQEGSYLVGAGRAKVTRLVHDCARRWHVPLQHGKVAGCAVIRPGVVEHKDLGQCGGGHFDDQPYSINPVIAAAKSLDCTAVCRVRRDHARVHKLLHARRCAPETRTRSTGCKTLYAHNHALHARARQLRASL